MTEITSGRFASAEADEHKIKLPEDTPTTLNGGIPPRLEKREFLVLEYTVGDGVNTPVHQAWAFYDPSGLHHFTIDSNRVLLMRVHPMGATVNPNPIR